jgi:hypothetical protein
MDAQHWSKLSPEKAREFHAEGYIAAKIALARGWDLTNPHKTTSHMWWGWEKAIKEGKQ